MGKLKPGVSPSENLSAFSGSRCRENNFWQDIPPSMFKSILHGGVFSFSTCFHCKQHYYTHCCLNTRYVLCHLCALTSMGFRLLQPCLAFWATHPILIECDVIATIGLYNTVHKSSLCECTFDKVYLFICKHLIINNVFKTVARRKMLGDVA